MQPIRDPGQPLSLWLAFLLASAACGGGASNGGGDGFVETLDISICDPSSASFSAQITNPYLPLVVGRVSTLEGIDDGVALVVEIAVHEETEVVAGVGTRVVVETETDDGELVEISRNFFAQAPDGTVCYFGEDVDDYEGGAVTGHGGAWRAGIDGAIPGILMPAAPAVGQRFRQELALGIAEDRAEIVAAGDPISTPAGEFSDTIELLESSPLDSGTSTKIFARGVGLIVDNAVRLVAATSPSR